MAWMKQSHGSPHRCAGVGVGLPLSGSRASGQHCRRMPGKQQQLMSVRNKVLLAVACFIAMGAITMAWNVNKPRLTMVLVSRTQRKDFGEYVIGLTNNGAAITYCGYAKQSPLYTCVRDTPEGPVTNFLGFL